MLTKNVAVFVDEVSFGRDRLVGILTNEIGISSFCYESDLLRIFFVSAGQSCFFSDLSYFIFGVFTEGHQRA